MQIKHYFYGTSLLLLSLYSQHAVADCNYNAALKQVSQLEFSGKKLYFVTQSGQSTPHNECSLLTVFDQQPDSNATFSQPLIYIDGISKIVKNKNLLEVITWREAEERLGPSPAQERHFFFVWDGNLFIELVKLHYTTSPYKKNIQQILVLLKQGEISKAQQLLISSKSNNAHLEYSMLDRIHLATQFLVALRHKLMAADKKNTKQLEKLINILLDAKFSNAIRTDDSNNDLSAISYQAYSLKTLDVCLHVVNQECTDKIIVSKQPETITALNDIAFFMGELKKYDIAIYLLDYLTRLEPKRVVSYLNLADLLWLRNAEADREDALYHYRTYYQQMKYDNKSKRIPKRVSNRVVYSKAPGLSTRILD